ncbi:nucleopolyhedrovirus P10 family protein [Streptomyces sp. NPDC005898]|uniref:nucleopolyhedrovirus P10 family protein n=1 Tax=Streptomyces sp. NPDC005898 TaxID=3157082 RepID=UPI0033E2E88F
MTGDGWTEAVRRQLGLGRVLPLGGARDGTWVTEAAAGAVLRHAAQRVTGVRLGGLRVAPADPGAACAPAVPPPPSALPPGPLRVTGDFTAATGLPLPAAADRLRAALHEAARGLGLAAEEVDLRVTALLDVGEGIGPEEDVRPPAPRPPAAQVPAGEGDEARAGQAALAVPGVTRLTGALGPAVVVEERPAPGALPRRHVRVELATGHAHRALDVALAVRAAVGDALADHPSVAVLVTAVETP